MSNFQQPFKREKPLPIANVITDVLALLSSPEGQSFVESAMKDQPNNSVALTPNLQRDFETEKLKRVRKQKCSRS